MVKIITASAGADEARPQIEKRAARRPARTSAPAVHTRAHGVGDIAREVRAQGREIARIGATVTRSEAQRRLHALKQRAQNQLRASVDQRDRLARRGRSDPLIDSTIRRANAAIDTANDRAMRALERENQQLRRQMRRPQIDVRGASGRRSSLSELQSMHRRATLHYLRTGETVFRGHSLADLQRRAAPFMRAPAFGGSGPDGGFLLMPQYETGPMEKLLAERVEMRKHCSVVTINSYTYKEFVQTESGGAKWGNELDSGGQSSTPKFSLLDIPAQNLYAEPRVSMDLLEDSMVDMEQVITDGVIDQFSLAEAIAYTTGNGVERPFGFLGYSADTYVANASWAWGKVGYTKTGANGAFPTPSSTVGSADPIIQLEYELKAEYAAAAKYMMNRKSIGVCRTLKDSEGRYVWSEGNVITGQPPTLNSREVIQNSQMPDIATGKFSVALADWMRFYKIVDRVGMTVLRDPYTNKPAVTFFVRKRVGGAIHNFEAGKLLQFSN